MSKSYPIDYELFKKIKTLFAGTAILVITQITFFTIFIKPGWLRQIGTSKSSFLQSLIWDRIIVEVIAVYVILRLLAFVGARWNASIQSNGQKILGYFALFLPIICCAYFLYAPITMGLRYLGRNWGHLDGSIYLTEYLFNVRSYLSFLIPTILFSYSLLVYNLYWNLGHHRKSATQDPSKNLAKEYSTTIEFSSNYRKRKIKTSDICWIEKRGRKVFLKMDGEEIPISSTLSDIEARLSTRDFFRVNRSALVARRMIRDYSFWENDKYILTTLDAEHKEFIMSRKKMQLFRDDFLANPLIK